MCATFWWVDQWLVALIIYYSYLSWLWNKTYWLIPSALWPFGVWFWWQCTLQGGLINGGGGEKKKRRRKKRVFKPQHHFWHWFMFFRALNPHLDLPIRRVCMLLIMFVMTLSKKKKTWINNMRHWSFEACVSDSSSSVCCCLSWWGWTPQLKKNLKTSDDVCNCNRHTGQMLMICALQERPAVFSHWMYCHLVMCSETCMSEPCCRSLISQSVERIRSFLLGHRFITSTKDKACGWGWGGGLFLLCMQALATDGCHQPSSVITAQIWSRVTVIFLVVAARSSLRGVQFISICCSVRPAVPDPPPPPSLTLSGAAGGLADPLVWE